MYLIFDTETTGFPKDWKAPAKDVDNWPRIIQIAYAWIADDRKTVLEAKSFRIQPDGWEVPDTDFYRNSGHTQEVNIREGQPIDIVLTRFLSYADVAKFLIAHNMEFDKNVLTAELIRAGMKINNRSLSYVCTKERGTNFCNIPGKYPGGRPKWPSLAELHFKLFNKPFMNAHDALGDVKATANCFFGLMNRGLLNGDDAQQRRAA